MKKNRDMFSLEQDGYSGADSETEGSPHHKHLLRDLVAVFLFVAASFAITIQFDIYEKFHNWSRDFEAYNLDEAPIIIFALAISLAWFSYRRWMEFRRELSARKRMEEQAHQAEQELHQAQKMEAVGQLTGGIAHDFSNLLTIIQGNLDLLTDKSFPEDLRDEMAEEALAACERGGELTRRLLAFARRQPLQSRPLDINGLVLGLSGLLRRTLGAQIEVETVTAGDLWVAVADPLQVENAILNLALNGRDAMPGGGRLRLETGNVILDEAYSALHPDGRPGEYVMLQVSDNGAGMSARVKERAFEPFFTTKPMGKGTGLGLSMVYGFARQSGGHVRIDSEEGEGCVIRFYLPRSDQTLDMAGLEETVSATVSQEGPGGRILLVEDDPGVRLYALRALQAAGYEVEQAENGAEAIEKMSQGNGFNLVFTDILMPGGIDGWELARQVKQMQPAARLLFTSGNPETALDDRVSDAGVLKDVDLLRKPYRRDELIRRVRAACIGSPG